MNVFTYWEGYRPEYIEVCLESMARVCGDAFHLITPDTLAEWLPDGVLHENYRDLPQPALRADCIRAALLATHGGWWWDADTVGIRSPRSLVAAYPTADALFATWNNPPVRVLNGYVYVRPGSAIARRWLEHVNQTLEHDAGNVEWCSLGEQVITGLMLSHLHAHRISRAMVLPIDIDSSVGEFFTKASVWEYINGSVCFGLNHSWFMYHRAAEMLLPRARWCESPLLIHQLLDWAARENET